jgi:hypothetical protein
LTSLKNKKIKHLILICVGISIVVSVIIVSDSSCGIQHISILNDLSTFEKTEDPEFCEILVEKIDSFNEQCAPAVEILDCG